VAHDKLSSMSYNRKQSKQYVGGKGNLYLTMNKNIRCTFVN